MEKLKVTVEFQNALCDRLYNSVEKAEFEWLKLYCSDKKELYGELIEGVNNAIYSVIKEFFDNSGENSDSANLEKRVEKLEEKQQLRDIYDEQQRQVKEIMSALGVRKPNYIP